MDFSKLFSMGLLPMLLGGMGGNKNQGQTSPDMQSLGQVLGAGASPQPSAPPGSPSPMGTPAPNVPNLASMMQPQQMPTGQQVKDIMGTDNTQQILQGLMRFLPSR